VAARTASASGLGVTDRRAAGRLQRRLVGTFSMSGGDGRMWSVAGKKNCVLLINWALSPGQRATRERLTGPIRDENGEKAARNCLGRAVAMLPVAMLRRQFGGESPFPTALQDDQPDGHFLATFRCAIGQSRLGRTVRP
jgi:hypothetical protein